jgi:hypothetical protein
LAQSGHCQSLTGCPEFNGVTKVLEGHAMKSNGTVMRIGATLLALSVSLLATPTSLEAQKAAGIARVGWLEVCGPGPKRPHFDIFRARLAELGYVEGKNLVIEHEVPPKP